MIHWQRMKDLNGYLSYFPLGKTRGATRNPKVQELEQDWLRESLPDSIKAKARGNQVDLLGGEIEAVVDYLNSI